MKIAAQFNFDECFQTFPRLRSPANLTDFWNKAMQDFKKVPVEPRQKLVLKKSLGLESMMDVSFQSFGGARIRAILSIPRLRKRVPVVISFHDYHAKPELVKTFADRGVAHMAMELRDHNLRLETGSQGQKDVPAPHFRRYGLEDLENSYPYACFLDAIRCVDFIRLQKNIDPQRIALWGQGFGAALAVFVAVQRKDIATLALENMGLTWMEGFLQESQGAAAQEIREIMEGMTPAKKTKLRKNLDYLDVLNWSEGLRKEALTLISLKDGINPPRSSFAFFNHLLGDKAMELFPEENAVLKREKAVRFLSEKLTGKSV